MKTLKHLKLVLTLVLSLVSINALAKHSDVLCGSDTDSFEKAIYNLNNELYDHDAKNISAPVFHSGGDKFLVCVSVNY